MINAERLMMKDDDFKLLRGSVTDRRTNGRTFVNVESFSRLKIYTFFVSAAFIQC